MPAKERLEQCKEKYFVVGKEVLKTGEIPSILVCGETLPEAWELATIATLEYGAQIPTEYDQDVDPESKDSSVTIVVTDPLKEPRIHRALPCGLDDLEIYVQEVVDGVHDSWVKEEGWSYSYHDRLTNWPGIGSWRHLEAIVGVDLESSNTNQINALIGKLAVAPHSRRAQATTWVPFVDSAHHEPPCLQRVWCRVVRSDDDLYLLQMNTHWRSRDAFKAAFMNMYAMAELQKKMAGDISAMSGQRVEVGRYLDISDSFHIYGSYIRKGEIEKYLRKIEKSSFEDRVYKSNSSLVQDEFARGRERLTKEV